MGKKTSLGDIAAALDVSTSLVSFVLNGLGDIKGISQETQQRVKAKAAELHYTPNGTARGLRVGKSQTIGLVVADISNRFYARIARKIEEVASENGYNLIFCSSGEQIQKEIDLIHMLRERNVDGMIVSTTQKNASLFARLKRERLPLVLIDRKIPRFQIPFVGVDNVQGAFDATSHLLQTGYRSIGMLKIRPSYISTIREREAGFRKAMKQFGLRVNSQHIREVEFEDIRGGVRRELAQMLKPPAQIQALIAANNNIAIQCLDYLTELNLRVPQDIALVSFDDIDLFRFCYPPLTAVAQPVEEIGAQAANRLFDQIRLHEEQKNSRHPSVARHPEKMKNHGEFPQFQHQEVILPVNLIERRSCGAFLSKQSVTD